MIYADLCQRYFSRCTISGQPNMTIVSGPLARCTIWLANVVLCVQCNVANLQWISYPIRVKCAHEWKPNCPFTVTGIFIWQYNALLGFGTNVSLNRDHMEVCCLLFQVVWTFCSILWFCYFAKYHKGIWHYFGCSDFTSCSEPFNLLRCTILVTPLGLSTHLLIVFDPYYWWLISYYQPYNLCNGGVFCTLQCVSFIF